MNFFKNNREKKRKQGWFILAIPLSISFFGQEPGWGAALFPYPGGGRAIWNFFAFLQK